MIRSSILKWLFSKQLSVNDNMSIWKVHGLLLLHWFVFPFGLIHEIYLMKKEERKKK